MCNTMSYFYMLLQGCPVVIDHLIFIGCDKGVGEEHDTSFLHNSCGSLIGVAVAESSLLKKWYKSQYFAFSWVHLFFARKSLDLLESYLLCNIFKVYLCMTLSMHLFTILDIPTNLGHIPKNLVRKTMDTRMGSNDRSLLSPQSEHTCKIINRTSLLLRNVDK